MHSGGYMSKKIDSLEDEINIAMGRYDVFSNVIDRMLATSDVLAEILDNDECV